MPTIASKRLRKDYLSVLDFESVDLERCLELAATLKRLRRVRDGVGPLDGQHVALVFEKPSFRTRATFEIAVRELGGHVIELPAAVTLGPRESPADVARNLERWVSGLVVRTYAQERLAALASAAPALHVINALTNEEHPCQALADVMTLREHWGTIAGKTIAFIGDGNNVAASLAHAGAMLGLHIRIASPEGFELAPEVVEAATRVARFDATIQLYRRPEDAARNADAIYTDVWTSMGREAEANARRRVFSRYQVNPTLMAAARSGALFLHCLPAHRGEEVTADVIDGPSAVVFDQAENRLHTQKALLTMLMGNR